MIDNVYKMMNSGAKHRL